LRRPWPILLAAYAVAGTALTPVLGGGWREAVTAALVGLIVEAVAIATRGVVRAEPIAAPIAAVSASFSATALAKLGINASPDLVTLAALVTFLPGMTLTIGMRELASEHLQSGVANTASALVQLLGLVFGVEIGRSIALNWFGPVGQIAPHPGFNGWHLLAAIAAGLAFTLTLRARYSDAYIMCAATVLAHVANETGAALFGSRLRRSPPRSRSAWSAPCGSTAPPLGARLHRPWRPHARARKRRLQQRPATRERSEDHRNHRRLRHLRHGDLDRVRPYAVDRRAPPSVHTDGLSSREDDKLAKGHARCPCRARPTAVATAVAARTALAATTTSP
jgi:uncharacterized membrane protein YjjB (DUF3815 family)